MGGSMTGTRVRRKRMAGVTACLVLILGAQTQGQAPTPLSVRLEQARDAAMKARAVMFATKEGQTYEAILKVVAGLEQDIAAQKAAGSK